VEENALDAMISDADAVDAVREGPPAAESAVVSTEMVVEELGGGGGESDAGAEDEDELGRPATAPLATAAETSPGPLGNAAPAMGVADAAATASGPGKAGRVTKAVATGGRASMKASVDKMPAGRKRKATSTTSAGAGGSGGANGSQAAKAARRGDGLATRTKLMETLKHLSREAQRNLTATMDKVGLREIVRHVDTARQLLGDLVAKLDALDDELEALPWRAAEAPLGEVVLADDGDDEHVDATRVEAIADDSQEDE